MKDMIGISEFQKKFILKAINNITTLYDFDNIDNKEFKETYGISKGLLIDELNDLKKELKC